MENTRQYQSILSPLPVSNTPPIDYWGAMPDAAAILAMSNTAANYNGLTLLLCANPAHIDNLMHAIHFFRPEIPLYRLPDWETLPYDPFSPHEDIVSQRLRTLSQLPFLKTGILLVSIHTLGQRLPPREFISSHVLTLSIGDQLTLPRLREQLTDSGYHNVSQVERHGEFAIRGAVIDLFPMGSEQPYRIELVDDEVETIRTFDIDTQRSIQSTPNIALLPAREFPLTDDAIARFRQQWRAKFTGNPAQCPIYQMVSEGNPVAGIEYYFPLFFEHTTTLFDYLPNPPQDSPTIRDGLLCIHYDESLAAYETFWQTLNHRYEQRAHDRSQPILPPQQLYLESHELFSLFKTIKQIKIKHQVKDKKIRFHFSSRALPDIQLNPKAPQPWDKLKKFLDHCHQPTIFFAESEGRRERLKKLLEEANLHCHAIATWQQFIQHIENPSLPQYTITLARLDKGFIADHPNFTVITENELLGERVSQPTRNRRLPHQTDAAIRNLTELKIGDPVVHIDHGVGRYQGLKTLTLDDQPDDYLLIQYANDNNLYVPIHSLQLVSRYNGADPEHAPLHALGNQKWQQAKQRATKKAHDAAAELLTIYAKRHAQKGFKHQLPQPDYDHFVSTFPFDETPDQMQAINDVLSEMCSQKSMDRLVCGDVGFGKTEVAMRAAFLAAQNGKQVAMLVPTTLLAQQHYENFTDRFANWPMTIELLSRFRNLNDQKKVLAALNKGTIDIIIATHRLLQRDIQFKNLGLVIIDEEHRFGVRHKERLKALRAEVDILTLTATPIPRTLNLSLAGIRDLSLIATPPPKRLAVKTFIRPADPHLIREAVMREILRGGQIYFLHNHVATIEKTANDLAKLIPEARVTLAHGQMRERQLEQIMTDFYHQRSNLLVCTTIIESGIDIPTANTILIDRADRFGIAQLHQLRGRVGRSHHQAYAYLLIPDLKSLNGDSKKRLNAVTELEALGVGFTLATHDLEIRGVGEILGEEQSGHIEEVGFNLYMSMLEHAVSALKSGQTPSLALENTDVVDIQLGLSAIIPADYLPDVHNRLVFYKRLANCRDTAAIDDLQIEMIDRFGPLPEPTAHLFSLAQLRQYAMTLKLKQIRRYHQQLTIEFCNDTPVEPQKLIALIKQYPKTAMKSATCLQCPIPEATPILTFSFEIIKCLL